MKSGQVPLGEKLTESDAPAGRLRHGPGFRSNSYKEGMQEMSQFSEVGDVVQMRGLGQKREIKTESARAGGSFLVRAFGKPNDGIRARMEQAQRRKG